MTEVTQHTAWGPNTEEDTRAYVQFVLDTQQAHPREGFELAICLKSNGTLLGGVGIHVMEKTNAEIGYVLNPTYQGKGYAAEAAALYWVSFSTNWAFAGFTPNVVRTTQLRRMS